MDENLSWIDHINTLENKLPKNLGLLYKVKPFLNTKAMKSPYFSFLHGHLTYGNIAWCSTSMAKLRNIFSKQKQAIKTISMASLDYKILKSEEILDRLGILNIYKLNIYDTINLMLRVKTLRQFFLVRIRIECTEIYSVNLHILSEYRKIRFRKNFIFGHFPRSKIIPYQNHTQ